MDRKTDLTLFAGYHLGCIVKEGGTAPPEMTYDDVHNLIDKFCAEFPVQQDAYTGQLERALKRTIKQAFPNVHEEDVLEKIFNITLKEAE